VHSTDRKPRLALAGGCGSSGTTLLAHLLGRHSKIVTGPELDFFNHPEAWSPGELAGAVDELFGRRRLSSGYKLVVGFCKPAAEFGIDAALVATWAKSSSRVGDLCDKLAAHVCAGKGAQWYVEKTPTNVYGFDVLSRSVPGMPLIHQIRDGRDVAASLVRRGKTLFYAGSRWLYDTLAGLRARGRDGYLELRYEDLVTDPGTVLARVLGALGLAFEDGMLSASGRVERAGEYLEAWRERAAPKHWTSVPSDAVSSKSIGCGLRELSERQLSMLYRIRLTDRAAADLAAPVLTFGELLDLLGYPKSPSQPMHVGVGVRLNEAVSEAADYVERARRSLRYTRRLPRIVTRIGPEQ
jgi:hypothetical protein